MTAGTKTLNIRQDLVPVVRRSPNTEVKNPKLVPGNLTKETQNPDALSQDFHHPRLCEKKLLG